MPILPEPHANVGLSPDVQDCPAGLGIERIVTSELNRLPADFKLRRLAHMTPIATSDLNTRSAYTSLRDKRKRIVDAPQALVTAERRVEPGSAQRQRQRDADDDPRPGVAEGTLHAREAKKSP